jgi:hypothetical protein
MPTSRLMFLLFVVVLAGSILYILYGPGQQSTESVTLSPRQYIERVQSERAENNAADKAADKARRQALQPQSSDESGQR